MQEMQETVIQSLGWENPLEEEMAVHSSILAWKIPWTEEPGGLQSMESQKSQAWLSMQHAHIHSSSWYLYKLTETCIHTYMYTYTYPSVFPLHFLPVSLWLTYLFTYLLSKPDKLKAIVKDKTKTCFSWILIKFRAIHSVSGHHSH